MKNWSWSTLLAVSLVGCTPRLYQPGFLPTTGEVELTGRWLGTGERGKILLAGRELDWAAIRSWNPRRVILQLEEREQDALVQLENRGRYSNTILLAYQRKDAQSNPLPHPQIDQVELIDGMVVALHGRNFGFFPREQQLLWHSLDRGFSLIRVPPDRILSWSQQRIRFVAPQWGDAEVSMNRGRVQSNRVEVSFPPASGQLLWGEVRTHTLRQFIFLGDSPAAALVHLPSPVQEEGQEVLKLESEDAPVDGSHTFWLFPQQGAAQVFTVRVRERWTVLDEQQASSYLANPLLARYRQPSQRFPADNKGLRGYAQRTVRGGGSVSQRAERLYRDFTQRFSLAAESTGWVRRVEPYPELEPLLTETAAGAEELVRLLTTLYRSVDIPARMLTGLKVGKAKVQAYAWLQIFLPRYGWFDLDPLRDLASPDAKEGWGRRHHDLIRFDHDLRTKSSQGDTGWRLSYSQTVVASAAAQPWRAAVELVGNGGIRGL